MELEFMSEKASDNVELFIYLDLDGKTALLEAIADAEADGHSHMLSSAWGGDELTISTNSAQSFHKVTITFSK